MDDQLVSVIEDQGDQFKEAACWVGADHQPAPGVVFFIERTRMQDVSGGIDDGSIVKSITLVMLPGRPMQLRQRVPMSVQRPGLPQSGS